MKREETYSIRPLNRRSISNRITKWHSQFNNISPTSFQREHQWDCRVSGRETGGDESDECTLLSVSISSFSIFTGTTYASSCLLVMLRAREDRVNIPALSLLRILSLNLLPSLYVYERSSSIDMSIYILTLYSTFV